MKARIKKYYQFGIFPFYKIECCIDGSWLSAAATASDDKELAVKLKKCVLKSIADGDNIWFLNKK